MRHLFQAGAAVVLLIGMPIVLETPSSGIGLAAAGLAALVLLGVAWHGVVSHLHTRKPKEYLDSVVPKQHVDLEKTTTGQKSPYSK